MPAAINQAHPAYPNSLDDLIFISNDHARLKFMRHQQPGVVGRTHVMVGGISLLAGGAVFHKLRWDSANACVATAASAMPPDSEASVVPTPRAGTESAMRVRVARNPHSAVLRKCPPGTDNGDSEASGTGAFH